MEKDGRGVILDPEISKENQDGHNNFLFPKAKKPLIQSSF